MLNKPKNKPKICKTHQNNAKYKTKNQLNINNLHIITKICKIYDLIPVSPQRMRKLRKVTSSFCFYCHRNPLILGKVR